jgi:hypothetical protein
MGKREISFLAGNRNRVVQTVASRFTDWAILHDPI